MTDDCLFSKQIPASVSKLVQNGFARMAQRNIIQAHLPQVDRVYDFNLRRYCSLLKHETLFYTDS